MIIIAIKSNMMGKQMHRLPQQLVDSHIKPISQSLNDPNKQRLTEKHTRQTNNFTAHISKLSTMHRIQCTCISSHGMMKILQ